VSRESNYESRNTGDFVMASLGVMLIILGCAAYQYLKGTLVKSFASIVIAVCAGVVAFGYFELLADVFVSRSDNSRFDSLVPWAQPLSFLLLFVLAFAVLQTIVAQLLRKPIDLGLLPERIGRVVCGIFLGFILSGLLLTTLAMAPLPNDYPYQRFDADMPDAEKPTGVLLNADGFATAWFSMLSNGSLSGRRSFATLHPAFVDQAFLNRHEATDGVSIITSSQAIELPPRRKKAAWLAPEGLKDSVGKPLPQKSDHSLTIVQVGIKRKSLKNDIKFTLSQLRLICKERSAVKDPFVGKGKNIYPIGYMKTADRLQTKKLNDPIKLEPIDFDGSVRYIDFAFYVPNDFLPVLVEFKQNSIVKLPAPVLAEEVPPTIPFIQLSACAEDVAELQPVRSAKVYGIRLATGNKFLADLTLQINDPNQWQTSQTPRSIKPAQFEDGKISYVRAELRIEKLSQKETAIPKPKSAKRPKGRPYKRPKKYVPKGKDIAGMLKPLDGYKLLSLKCNSPSTGAVTKAQQLPVLVELSGSIHHPVGVIALARLNGQNICEVDYCSLTADRLPDGLVIAEDGSVAQPFPDTVWLTGQAQSIADFYVLYLVKSGRNAIITAVQPSDSRTPAAFKEYEGFLIK